MNTATDSDLIDELKNIGVKLVDTTKRNVNGYCPIHSPDLHPSFFFNLDTELYQCFGCKLRGKGIERLRFQVTGISSNVKYIPRKIRPIKYQLVFRQTPSIPESPLALGNKGEQYLLGRGFTRETIEKFKIFYNIYEDCIYIPLEKMGYVQRFLHDREDHKKYKYIPGSDIDSDLYGMGDYNMDKVKGAILVEGSLDAIWLHQLGYRSALAILHPDVSPQQLKVLKGVTSTIYLLLDNDRGGIETEEKIEKKLKEASFIVRKCRLPESKDPNDCTAIEIEEAIKNSKL